MRHEFVSICSKCIYVSVCMWAKCIQLKSYNCYLFVQELAMNRPPSRREEKYAHKHGLVALFEMLEEEGETRETVNREALPP